MRAALRDGFGLLLVVVALSALAFGVRELRGHDYLAALLLLSVGLSVLRAGVELLRPSVGE
jgi:hypothetical protein